ncbi:hypothetical protein C3492_39865 [Streptomyces sp. Ru62]|nr:hypothetical protein C3492_39865 [Streptomyces sp. Ru62]
MARLVVGVVMDGDLADVRVWAGELEAVHERFVHRFSRSEPRESATSTRPDGRPGRPPWVIRAAPCRRSACGGGQGGSGLGAPATGRATPWRWPRRPCGGRG